MKIRKEIVSNTLLKSVPRCRMRNVASAVDVFEMMSVRIFLSFHEISLFLYFLRLFLEEQRLTTSLWTMEKEKGF